MKVHVTIPGAALALFLIASALDLPSALGGTTETIAAGTSQTNLPTETVWPGAQDPPYICCWIAQGQFVTFTFTVSGGSTDLALRYSAGKTVATRTIEIDEAVVVANQSFPHTANWSTWAALTLNRTLSAGTHTLTVIFESAAGSSGYLNLDNLTVTAASVSNSQTIAAGTSSTNLPTETRWPGAQNPPYICCWNAQGQFVTFAFDAASGATNFVLRYSAGSGAITRKILLDGAVCVANQMFAGTGNWSTWTTLALNTSVNAGAHTLTVIFDTSTGSTGFLNLDNLTVSAAGGSATPPPAGLTVALGYADDATGLTPWSGSSNTVFIGEPPQCCSTHGSDNGSPGYDGGAIEITNSGTAAVTVSAVSVDFGGASSPSQFALWGSGAAPDLPQTLQPGWHLVLTARNSFNFDTSDLLGEACHTNSGVVPVVHVTFGGQTTDYLDDHQILNSDGADEASCPGDVSEQKPFAVVTPGTQSPAAPANDVPPSVTGVATQIRILSGFAGAWNASPPPAIAFHWRRCDSAGNNCSSIAGATTVTYKPVAADVNSTLRLQVTASNATGTRTLSSPATAAIRSGPVVTQMGDTSTGFTSVYVQTSTQLHSIFTAPSSGTTLDFEFFARGAGGTQSFTPRIYSVVNGAKGASLGVGPTVTVPMGTSGRWYVASLSGVHLSAGAQYMLALDPSGTKSTYVGSETNGTYAFFVDYQ